MAAMGQQMGGPGYQQQQYVDQQQQYGDQQQQYYGNQQQFAPPKKGMSKGLIIGIVCCISAVVLIIPIMVGV